MNNNNTHAIHHAVFPCCSVHPNSRCSINPDITATWNRTLQDVVYHMRVYDALSIICELYPPSVTASGAPFKTTHYITIGHSLGGAAAAGVLAVEDSTLDGVSLDGLFMDLSDVNKPFLLLAGAETIPALDPTWSSFSVGLV